MEDLKSYTKAQLIEMIEQQEDLKQQLSSQRRDYDEAMRKTKREHDEELEKCKKEVGVAKSAEIDKIREESQKVREENQKIIFKLNEAYNFIGKYTSRYQSFLKAVQGSLELAVELESEYVQAFNKLQNGEQR